MELIFVKLHFFNFWRLELPNITGSITMWGARFLSWTGAFTKLATNISEQSGVGSWDGGATFSANLSNTIYSDPVQTVQPASNQVLITIKV